MAFRRKDRSSARRPKQESRRDNRVASARSKRRGGGQALSGRSQQRDLNRARSYSKTRNPQANSRAAYNEALRKERRSSSRSDFRTVAGGRMPRNTSSTRLSSVRIGDLNRETQRRTQSRSRSSLSSEKKTRNFSRLKRIAAWTGGIVAALIVTLVILAQTPAFTIENISVQGADHLTSDEMTQMIEVPQGTTLLTVDEAGIANRLKQNAWIEDVQIRRIPPNTLEIHVTERNFTAVVEIPDASSNKTTQWAISDDRIWLMPIPEQDSDAGKATSPKVYEDANNVLHITDVPYTTQAEIGQVCTDGNVNNALSIVAGMTTELADQVKTVSAAGPDETKLVLDNGVEIAFGKAENIRDKENVVLSILNDNPGKVSYINVRVVDQPTWRSI
ncbi:MAG: cell division protein FtsQ/DivIB [Eggerthellaceae bacterium]|jgi:cell division protein FtsQ